MPTVAEPDLAQTDPRLAEALLALNEIGGAINQLTPRGHAGVDETLRLIAESAIKVVPGSAAVIYTYDPSEQLFEAASRVSAGEPETEVAYDLPRPDGIGMRAIRQRRRVLSYEEPDVEVGPVAAKAGAWAVACFPLVVATRPVGALYVYLHQAHRIGRSELLMLDNLVNHAAMAIYQARRLANVQQDLVRSEEALERLRKAGMLISSQLGLEETLESILEMALDVTGAQYGIFRLVDESGTKLVTRAVAGAAGRPQLGVLPIDGTSIMGWVAKHRQSLCVHDLESAPWVRLYHPLDADIRMRSELAVPLVGSSGRLEGVLNLESPLVGAFSEQDSHLLNSLATQAVIAVQAARLLDALLEVGRLLLIEPYPRLLDHLVKQAADLLNASASAIWILDDETLVLEAATDSSHRGERLPLRGSLIGQAIRQKAPVIAEDVRDDQRFHRSDLARKQAWTRALIVPLLSSEDGAAIGAFSVYGVQGEGGRFTESEWDKKVLTCLAYYAALAFQNADRQRALRLVQERHAVAETFAAVGDVAANVLHHLNNKVGAIPVRVQGIRAKCAPALAADDYLAANLTGIEGSAREAMDAIRDSLANLRPIHAGPVTVPECVRAALADVQLPEGIRVDLVSLEDLPPVVASQRSLAFVFRNLLNNAITAMAGSGAIVIRGQTAGPWVEVLVEDDGPGIPEHLHERIFEFDLPTRNSRRNDRLGFGLWWVKTLMMRLGGAISVECEDREGTRFLLRLPRLEDARV